MLEERSKKETQGDVFLTLGEDLQLPLGLAGYWSGPNIPWARLTLGLAGFSLGNKDLGVHKSNAPGGGYLFSPFHAFQFKYF